MTEKLFAVTDNQTTEAVINMSVNFVDVIVNTDLQYDIYVDDEYKGNGTWSGRLTEGSHVFEARTTDFVVSKQNIDLLIGETKIITLDSSEHISESMDINTSPMEANIYIDGVYYGQTPNYINEIAVGNHELRLEKKGFETIVKTVSVEIGKTLTLNEKMIEIESSKADLAAQESNENQDNDQTEHELVTVSNGFEYVDLGLPSGVKWASCNVGASSPEEYGNYYAWGETVSKSEFTENNSITNYKNFGDVKGNPQYDAAQANMGGRWRLPTKSEMEELKDKCTWTLTTMNGVKGYEVKGLNDNSIFLPLAGFYIGSSHKHTEKSGQYWTSTPNNGNDEYDFSYRLYINRTIQNVGWDYRSYGRSIRPVID